MALDDTLGTEAQVEPAAGGQAPVEQPNEAASAEQGRRQAATKLARGIKHQTPYDLAPRPASAEDYAGITPGTEWVDPEGTLRKKPYQPTSPDDYRQVPEGADWVDPEGNVRTKAVYQDIGFTAQTLYNMATNDKERKKALEHAYPGKVKVEEGTGDIYVEDDGVNRKPRGFTKAPGAALVAGALPAAGAVAGEIGGGIAGSVLPGPGTLGGAIAGAIAGGAIGQGFNDAILKSLGITDRSTGEEVGGLALAGAAGGAGTAIGRLWGAGGVAANKIATMNPASVANAILETDPQALRTGIQMAEKGVQYQPISPMFPGAPHLINVVEVYDRAFHTQQPLRQEAVKHYENQGKQILEGLGVKDVGSLSEPTAATPVKETGQKLLDKARAKVEEASAQLRAAYEAKAAPLEAGKTNAPAVQQTRVQALEQAQRQSRAAAEGFINATYQDIRNDVERAIQQSGAGRNSGELWEQVAARFTAARRAFGQEADQQYNLWREQFGEIVPPRAAGLGEEAETFLMALPEPFRQRYPALVQALSRMAPVHNEEGELVREAIAPNLSELQGLRTAFRHGIDWADLRSNWLNGASKRFEGVIDRVMDSERSSAQQLNQIDRWYRENGAIFQDNRIQAVINGLKGGEPADPKTLYDMLIKEGRTDLNRRVEGIVGPNLWRGIQAADTQALMDATRTEVPGQIDGNAFIREVISRERSGMLRSIHGEATANRWLGQVQNLKMLDGRLPISVRPGDRITEAIEAARNAAAELKEAVKIDPLALLNKELKQMRAEHSQAMLSAQRTRRQEPLGFLHDPTVGANEAAERILGSSDLIYAAEKMFGQNSDEFKALQLSWTRQILEGTLEPGKRLVKHSEDVQRLMMPGVTFGQMEVLAKEMDQLMSTRGLQETAKSMAAQSKVEHPWSGVLGRGGSFVPKLPGADFVMRSMLGGYFGMVRSLAGKQWLLKWLENGLQSNDPLVKQEARDALKAQFRRAQQIMGAAGSGAGEGAYQAGQDHSELAEEVAQ